MAVRRATRRTGATASATRRARKEPPATAQLSSAQLSAQIRLWLSKAEWLSAAALKKLLPKAQHADGLGIARELATQGALYRYSKGSAEHFFAQDPIAKLETLVPVLLEGKALTQDELRESAEHAAPGTTQLLPEWLKNALARRIVFKHSAGATKPKGKKHELYAGRPDLRALLKRSLAALAKELESIDAASISRESALEFLAAELGIRQPDRATPLKHAPGARSPSNPSAASALRGPFLAALQRLAGKNGSGALLSVRQLRADTGMDKQSFDQTALALSREGAVVLHHHDHAASLPEGERRLLIRDPSGTHYVGIALRGKL